MHLLLNLFPLLGFFGPSPFCSRYPSPSSRFVFLFQRLLLFPDHQTNTLCVFYRLLDVPLPFLFLLCVLPYCRIPYRNPSHQSSFIKSSTSTCDLLYGFLTGLEPRYLIPIWVASYVSPADGYTLSLLGVLRKPFSDKSCFPPPHFLMPLLYDVTLPPPSVLVNN